MAGFKKEKKQKLDIGIDEKREIDGQNKEQSLNTLFTAIVEKRKKEIAKKNDGDLSNLREELKDINDGYKEGLALIDAKIDYTVKHLGTLVGGLIGSEISEQGE